MDEELETIEAHWTEPYKVNGVVNLYLELDESTLETEVPEGAKWGSITTLDDDGNVLETRQKLVSEFAMHNWPSINEGKIILLCCALETPCLRQSRFSVDDAEDWKYFAEAVWGVTEFLTRDDAKQLIYEA